MPTGILALLFSHTIKTTGLALSFIGRQVLSLLYKKVYIVINKKIALRSAIVAAALAPAMTMASGYKINEQSAAGMGTAHAGRAAMAEDASVVFYNPAAMTQLDRAQISGGFTYINGYGDFEGNGTNAAGETITGAQDADPYDNGGNFLGEKFIPFFYYANPVSDKLAFGLGVYTPFGTETNYDESFVGGGFADKTSLISLELQPSVAYQINDQLSIGGGLDIVYMEGTLSKFVDSVPYSATADAGYDAVFAGAKAQGADDATAAAAAEAQVGYTANSPVLDPANAGFEGHYEVNGDDWGVGWNIALFYELSEATNLGFTYRSEIDVDLEGDSEFRNNSLAVYNPGTGATPADDSVTTYPVRNQASKVPLTTPQSATLSLTHQATDKLMLQAGATWTGWSSFEYFDILATENVASPTDPTGGLADGQLDISDVSAQNGLGEGYIGHIVEKWEDVWAVAVGGTYQLNDRIKLRTGYAYDQSPVTDEYRTARVPSSDRQWFTLGMNYAVNNDFSFDIAAAHLLMYPMDLNEVNKGLDDQPTDSKASVNGEYEIDVFGLSVQANYRF